jgi:hypothetical protein
MLKLAGLMGNAQFAIALCGIKDKPNNTFCIITQTA